MKSTIIQSIVAAAFLGLTYTGHAQYSSTSRDVLALNTGTAPGGGVTLNGTTFTNLGLQGVGRIAANTTDVTGLGETFGSISDMQITNWGFNSGLGQFTGTFNFLPDRGYNAGATFSNYAARINTYDFTFTPYTSSATTTAQNQIAFANPTSTRFTYDPDGAGGSGPRFTTGLLATGTTTFGGISPAHAANTAIGADPALANRLTLDSEGLILDTRAGKEGTGWVSDEYGPYIYHFNASKEIDGIVTLPQAIIPHNPVGTTNFNTGNLNGRRENQGMEGIAISPDGTRLFAMLQSATLQDSGAGNPGRSNTRILVYDITGSDLPTDPIDQYVLQLPRIDTDLSGTVDRTGAQSSILSLSNTELLILSRDGNGRGANNNSPVFKSILLANLPTGTDIDGTYDGEGVNGDLTSSGDTLKAGIVPVSWIEALNIIGKVDLGVTEIGQFGLNLLASDGDINTLSEKWEGLALVDALDTADPNDRFLFIGNDNDFITQTGSLVQADGTTVGYNAGLENDTMVLAYRVTIVPEPGSLAMLGCAAVGLLGFRRRRQG